MSIVDKLGREIEIGSNIIYTNIGTIGEVLDTKTDENGSWVLIAIDELNKLWYNTKYVELTTQTQKQFASNEDDNQEDLSVEDIEKQLNKSFNADMGGDAVGGG